jgi:dTMP kinase
MKMSKNAFIALEGIDGSGKSTQTKLLCQRLAAAGYKEYATFEPTDGPIGSMIRNIMKGNMKADDRTIAGLFVADRLDHLLNEENGIVKKLAEGYTVITDRYYFSSYAYHGTHMDMDWVIQANAMSARILRPDLNIFIDVSPETSMQRLSKRNNQIELYETLDNLKKVREKYMEAFDKLKAAENICIIDGNRSFEDIAADIWKVTQKILTVADEPA